MSGRQTTWMRVGLLWSAGSGVFGACSSGGDVIAFDVVQTPFFDCSVTGQAARNCKDEAQLRQTEIHARWLVELGAHRAFTLLLDDGRALPGLIFPNDGRTLNDPGCQGEGGDCYFARDRFVAADASQQDCQQFRQTLLIAHRTNDTLVGQTREIAGTEGTCVNTSASEQRRDVQGKQATEPALSRAGASP